MAFVEVETFECFDVSCPSCRHRCHTNQVVGKRAEPLSATYEWGREEYCFRATLKKTIKRKHAAAIRCYPSWNVNHRVPSWIIKCFHFLFFIFFFNLNCCILRRRDLISNTNTLVTLREDPYCTTTKARFFHQMICTTYERKRDVNNF